MRCREAIVPEGPKKASPLRQFLSPLPTIFLHIPHCHVVAKPFESAPVLRKTLRPLIVISLLACIFSTRAPAQEVVPESLELLISVADQRLVFLREGEIIAKYRVSTSRFGIGDSFGSYKTPVGQFKVCDKVGEALASGTVIKHRVATAEVLPVNAAGRDPIVTRVIWLEGLEEQNRNAKARGIYIHGTTEENKLGNPVSWGCIRMRSSDVTEIFDHAPVGMRVSIIAGKLPKLHKYVPAPPVIIAASTPPAKTVPDIAAKKAEPAPHLAANSPPAHPARLAPVASGPGLIPADPGAAQALKGSILSAGLPDGAQKSGPQKQDSMRFQSWSAVSLRDPDTSDKTARTH